MITFRGLNKSFIARIMELTNDPIEVELYTLYAEKHPECTSADEVFEMTQIISKDDDVFNELFRFADGGYTDTPYGVIEAILANYILIS